MVHPTYLLIIPLITAHLIADFVLQSENSAAGQARAWTLVKHSLIVGLLSYVLLGIYQAWLVGLVIFASHAVIDFATVKRTGDGPRDFVLDQAAHILVIGALAYAIVSRDLFPLSGLWLRLFGRAYYLASLIVSGMILSVWVGGILVGFAVKPFLDQIEQAREGKHRDGIEREEKEEVRGFEEGGRTIGYLERALIYVFVLVNQPTGIGFLVAAKSVFRFGELGDRSSRMEAEYIIIGTLYSFLYGLLVSYGISILLEHI